MMKVVGWFKLHPMLGKTIGDNDYVFYPQILCLFHGELYP